MKKVTILNGITDDSYRGFEEQLKQYSENCGGELRVDLFKLRDMDIKYCTGCWNCWLKTPGVCMHRDQMPDVLRSVINSDLMVILSPVVMGFVSKYIKKASDRMIPLVHPYVGIFGNECHHYKRYEHYPKFGLVLLRDTGDGSGPQDPDTGIITDIYRRMAINMRSSLIFSVVTEGDVEVLINEIDNI